MGVVTKSVMLRGEVAMSLKSYIELASDEWLIYEWDSPSEGVTYDVAVFDVSSDADNQFAEIAELRRMMKAKRIVVIDALDSEDNRIRAYDADADTVVSVPISLKGFMHLLDNQWRKRGNRDETITGLYELGKLLFDVTSGVISYLGGSVKLPLQAGRLLGCLCAHRGEVVKKTDLISVMTNGSGEMSDAVFRVQMSRVRKALSIDPNIKIESAGIAGGFRLL